MRKKYLNGFMIIGLVSVMILLVGCGVGPNPGNVKIKDYHVGTQGIVLQFFKANIKDVFEKDFTSRALYIQNKGAYTLEGAEEATLSISFDEYYINLAGESPTPVSISIPEPGDDDGMFLGKSISSPLGDETYFEYIFRISPLDTLRETIKTTINYQLCYPYKTEMTTAVCIDTRKYTLDQSPPVCKQTTYSSSTGQGAPVAIQKIVPEISVSGDTARPQFSIYIVNKGDGYVINNTGNDLCSAENIAKRAESLGLVKVSAMLSGRELNCTPGYVRLKSGDNIARCFVAEQDLRFYNRTARNYVAPLTVTLDYGYVVIEKEEITIKRLDEYRPDVEATACGYYEIADGRNCVSYCDFCKNASHLNDARCRARLLAGNNSPTFQFTSDFGCQCTKGTCLNLRPTDQCVFGFCTGDSYCCNSDECRDKPDNTTCGDLQTCQNHNCMEGPQYTVCEITYGGLGYDCMKENLCNQTTIARGLCPPSNDPTIVCCHR